MLASFFCVVASGSSRPKSVLHGTLAALTCLFEALGSPGVFSSGYIIKLISGLIKSGTTVPMTRTPVMPISPFQDMFRSWPDNFKLSLSQLRLKAITLLAIVFMLRPSDIAPHQRVFHADSMSVDRMVFSENQVSFREDGYLTVVFQGIKNDYKRDGFTVSIPPAEDPQLDPGSALCVYMQRTRVIRESIPGKPVFLSLRKPFHGLSAKAISSILQDAIHAAGLANQGYSAKCFRPTGATRAIDEGIHPDKARYVGRWASQEVFEKHYVHTRLPANYVDSMLK